MIPRHKPRALQTSSSAKTLPFSSFSRSASVAITMAKTFYYLSTPGAPSVPFHWSLRSRADRILVLSSSLDSPGKASAPCLRKWDG